MVLDPLTAIGLAGSLVQFVDYTSKIVGKTHHIYKSADGSLSENIDAETVAQTLQALNLKITKDLLDPSSAQEQTLKELCTGCDNIAQELLKALAKLKIQGKKTKWKSLRQALKSVSTKDEVDAISRRLTNFRDQLNLNFLVALSDRLDLTAIANTEDFKGMAASTQAAITAIVEARDAFDSSTALFKELHIENLQVAETQHNSVLEAIVKSKDSSSQDHGKTRDELRRVSEEAANLRQDMMKELEQIKVLIKATAQASGERQLKQLKEKATVVSASWFAKEIIYSHLMSQLRTISKENPTPEILPEHPAPLLVGGSSNIRASDHTKPHAHILANEAKFAVDRERTPEIHRELETHHSTRGRIWKDPDRYLGDKTSDTSCPISHGQSSSPTQHQSKLTELQKDDERYFGIFECNRCDEELSDVHYHCYICDDDDFDICERCAHDGLRCNDDGHWMMKRFHINGKIIISSTGALAPRKMFASPMTKAVLSKDSITEPFENTTPSQTHTARFGHVLETRGVSEDTDHDTDHFEKMRQSAWELGLSGSLINFPKSYLFAVSNRFSRLQIDQFQILSRTAGGKSLPLFFVGSDIYPATVFQKIGRQGSISLGSISRSMTVGKFCGYNRHDVQGQHWSSGSQSTEANVSVKGMVLFGLSDSQRRSIKKWDLDENIKLSMVEIDLNDGSKMRLEAGIPMWNGSVDSLVSSSSWSPSNYVHSYFNRKEIMDAERALEYGTREEQDVLVDCVKEMGFTDSAFDVPTSLLRAITNRLTREQVRQRGWDRVQQHWVFFTGSSMFPAYVSSRTPGATLEGIANLMTPGILRGYNRHVVRGHDWQALYPSGRNDDQVKGIVYLGNYNCPEGIYDRKKVSVEIELVDGTKMDVQVFAYVWNGKKEDLVPLEEMTWSPSTFLHSAFFKTMATSLQHAEDKMAFDQAFRNFQRSDTLVKISSSWELSDL